MLMVAFGAARAILTCLPIALPPVGIEGPNSQGSRHRTSEDYDMPKPLEKLHFVASREHSDFDYCDVPPLP